MRDKNNILHIPKTIDKDSIDDKMAYFTNYLYTYPFNYKHHVKLKVLSQDKKAKELEGEKGSKREVKRGYVEELDFHNNSSFYSNVFTSEDYLESWDGFVPVHSDWMKRYLTTKDYTRVRDELYSKSIIDIDWSYSNFTNHDKYPISYKLNDDHRFSTTTYSVNYPNSRFLNKRSRENQKYYQSLTPLLQLLNDKIYEINFDYDAAYKFISENEFKSKKKMEYSKNAKTSRFMAIEIMKDKSPFSYYLHEGYKVRRVFSPITSLPKDLRPYLIHNNQFLWDTDMSCALPTLFNVYLKDLNTEDVKLYRWLTSETKDNYGLYEFLGELWNIDDRDKVKILSMVLFFGNNYTITNYRRSFRQEFPNVYKVMSHLKKENYKFLAGDLMNLERKIMIDTVVSDFLDLDPGKMVLTIHDGVLTLEEHTIQIKNMIQDSAKNIVGVKPKVKIEPLK